MFLNTPQTSLCWGLWAYFSHAFIANKEVRKTRIIWGSGRKSEILFVLVFVTATPPLCMVITSLRISDERPAMECQLVPPPTVQLTEIVPQ